jgi:hypothetical protein
MATYYPAQTDRDDYEERLIRRLTKLVAREAPDRALFALDAPWEGVAQADRDICVTLGRWKRGLVPKEELDQMALAYLDAWREQFRHHGAGESERWPATRTSRTTR